MNKIIKEIIKIGENEKNIKSILLVGSFVNEESYQDIDIIILYENNYDNFENKLNFINNSYILDDSKRFYINNIEYSFVYKNEIDFLKYLNEIIKGNKIDIIGKQWAIGGYISEILLNDISKSILLFDKTGSISLVRKNLIKTFPSKLKNKLINYLKIEIKLKLKNYKTISDSFLKGTILKDIQIALIRFFYVKNEYFFPGLKKINISIFSKKEQVILNNILYGNIDTMEINYIIK